MPRNNGIYSPPSGTTAVSQTPISSAAYNNFVADITADQNNPRPITAGGTGSATAQGAIDAFFGAPRTIVDERLLFVDPSDPTKRFRLDAGNVTAGQTRVLTMPDENLNLGDLLPKPGGTMTGLLTLAPSDDDPDGTASLNIPAGADTPDVQADGDIWADSNEDLRYRRGGEDATVYDTVNLPRPEPGEMAAGTETAPRALSAADVRAGVAFSKMWESAPQSLTTGGRYVLAHSLGVVPKIVEFEFVCITAEYNFSVGEVVVVSGVFWNPASTSAGKGYSYTKDATAVSVNLGTTANPIMAYEPISGGPMRALTKANWEMIVRAFA